MIQIKSNVRPLRFSRISDFACLAIWFAILMPITTALVGVRDAAAETPFFWDDFERETVSSERLDWGDGDKSEQAIVDGSAVIQPLADEFPGIWAETEYVEEFSIRAKLRFLGDFSAANNPWIGVWARDPVVGDGPDDGAYWGGVDARGILYIGKTPPGGGIDIHSQTSVFSAADVVENDIHYQFDAVGDEISVRAWLDGDEKPVEPQLRMRDSTFPFSVVVGMFENPGPTLSGFAVRHYAMLPYLDGDFNASKQLDAEDIDLLSEELRGVSMNRAFDLTEDAMASAEDRNSLVRDLLHTYFGDSNLDGEFNSSDFVAVFEAGEYEDDVVGNSTWSTGDWNGDGEFDSGDFVVAFQDGGYEKGPRDQTPAVPEPGSFAFACVGGLWLLSLYRRCSRN